MKYSIFVNQKFLAEVAPQISFDEAAVFDFIKDLCMSENQNIEARRRDGYSWINYSYLLNEMPLLSGRTKKTVGDKIKKLEGYGLIKTKLESDGCQKNKYIKLADMTRFIDPEERGGIDGNFYNLLIRNRVNESQAKIMASDKEFLNDRERFNVESLIDGGKLEKQYDNNPAVLWAIYCDFKHIENICKIKKTNKDVFGNLPPIVSSSPPHP